MSVDLNWHLDFGFDCLELAEDFDSLASAPVLVWEWDWRIGERFVPRQFLHPLPEQKLLEVFGTGLFVHMIPGLKTAHFPVVKQNFPSPMLRLTVNIHRLLHKLKIFLKVDLRRL